MIKKFEQFISEQYVGRINEGFQSSKLRNLIKQHGLPREKWQRRYLYEITDEDIVDVVDQIDYYEKYSSLGKEFDRETAEATFPIILKDFTYVVIGNLGILYKDIYPGLGDCEEFYYYLGDIFRNRHKERHIGNLGKGEDEIHNKHIENVDKINGKRLAEKLIPFVDEIVDEAEDLMYKVTIRGVGPVNRESYCSVWLDEDGLSTTAEDISLGGRKYKLVLKYKNKWSNIKKSDDTFDYYDLYHELEQFAVIKHEDGKFTAATNEDLGITKETHKNLFQTHTVKNARASRNHYRQEDPRDRGRKGHYLVEPDDPNRIIN